MGKFEYAYYQIFTCCLALLKKGLKKNYLPYCEKRKKGYICKAF